MVHMFCLRVKWHAEPVPTERRRWSEWQLVGCVAWEWLGLFSVSVWSGCVVSSWRAGRRTGEPCVCVYFIQSQVQALCSHGPTRKLCLLPLNSPALQDKHTLPPLWRASSKDKLFFFLFLLSTDSYGTGETFQLDELGLVSDIIGLDINEFVPHLKVASNAENNPQN